MDIKDDMADELYRRRASQLASSITEHNALYKRIVERSRAEWAALPWHVKLRRKAKARCRSAIWRVKAAWRVLRTGDID